jgi:hypothetical protein
MKLSDIARLSIKQDSTAYNTMLGCDLLSRLTENGEKQKLENNSRYNRQNQNFKKKIKNFGKGRKGK